MPKSEITLSYSEAIMVAELLYYAVWALSYDDPVPDTWEGEAELAVTMILERTDG